jgi:hypothetical protein
MVTASFIYLVIVFSSFLKDADTSFAAATDLNNNTLPAMIVHRRPFTPPNDSSLRVPYIHLMERVVRGLDTIDRTAKNIAWERRKFLADLFNSYSTSIDEYRWVRKQTIRTLRLGVQRGTYSTEKAKATVVSWLMIREQPEALLAADSANIRRLRMAADALIRHAQPLVDNDDSEALK